MAKKTAMQQLIDKLNQSNPKIEFLTWIQDYNNQQKLLQTDREKFKDAYNAGYRDGEADGAVTSLSKKDISEYSNASDWFSETYETE